MSPNRAQAPPRQQQAQFKVNPQSAQQRAFRQVHSNVGYTGVKRYQAASAQQQQGGLVQNPNRNTPLNIPSQSVVSSNTPTVVSKTLLDSKTVNGTLVETYQFKYSDNTYLNKTYLDGFLISSVDPVGGVRVTYTTNIQDYTDFINRQQGSKIKYTSDGGYINNMNYYTNLNLDQQLQNYLATDYENPNGNNGPNYKNRFLDNLII